MNNVTVIIWTCITVAVLLGICALVLLFISSRNMKKNREAMRDLQGAIKVGAKILFAGGIYGKIVRIKNDVIDVEVNKSTVIQISRYSIQNVISEKEHAFRSEKLVQTDAHSAVCAGFQLFFRICARCSVKIFFKQPGKNSGWN